MLALFIIVIFLNRKLLRKLSCRGSRVVKWAGLKILWLSAFVGSNPTPGIVLGEAEKIFYLN